MRFSHIGVDDADVLLDAARRYDDSAGFRAPGRAGRGGGSPDGGDAEEVRPRGGWKCFGFRSISSASVASAQVSAPVLDLPPTGGE
ncbi:hypothetical protein Acsp06_24840 [Actinomycetospora sp. NBRC 106375]|uniref:hypothetical protein n=1 Tax=Actinomycetospora sp. NBRC 106375 TaxID=3032207 RepID=UPI0024A1DE8F|nr:hypothetical protein [Actinomycetospora sp. NBRC 106375]GLZ46299.1 hypothetical protein Acsp06_24840 [Actinomycetospora sp. NBRC 106375]